MANKVRCWYHRPFWSGVSIPDYFFFSFQKVDKNDCNLKILYKCIKANTSPIWQHMLHIPPTKVLLTAQTKQKDKIKSLLSGKWKFREKDVRRMGQKQKRIRDKKSD